ncbi:MAG: hypothetical protein CFE22_03875 [Cytophagaceae bacterium BCCC1]|nr:MAG: hypothetical protein CFE22_03875 [Cytophagaceae bacterium BCCC1]
MSVFINLVYSALKLATKQKAAKKKYIQLKPDEEPPLNLTRRICQSKKSSVKESTKAITIELPPKIWSRPNQV